MRHRRGIDFGRPKAGEIVYLGPLLDPVQTTFDDIPEWHAIGGYCVRCEHEGWINRWDESRKWGTRTFLSSLAPRLRCLACGNKEGNKWILGQLPR